MAGWRGIHDSIDITDKDVLVLAESVFEWFEFGLDVLKAIVWPAVVLIAVILFRKQLSDAMERLSEVSGPGVSAKFAKRVEEVAHKVDELVEASPPLPPPDTSQGDLEPLQRDLDIEASVVTDPTMRFLLEWIELERHLRDAAVSQGRPLTPAAYARQLVRSGALPSEALDALQELQAIRNGVTHEGMQLDAASSERLVESVRSMGSLLVSAARRSRDEHIFDRERPG